MMIYLGADHAGYGLKESIKKYLDKEGVKYRDLGAHELNLKDDYPDYGFKVAEAAVSKKDKGILVCGSAEGICIAANKVKGARAVAVWDEKSAMLSRKHNDSNILCLSGGKTVEKIKGLGLNEVKAKRIIDVWLKTPFSGEARHKRRIRKITSYEK